MSTRFTIFLWSKSGTLRLTLSRGLHKGIFLSSLWANMRSLIIFGIVETVLYYAFQTETYYYAHTICTSQITSQRPSENWDKFVWAGQYVFITKSRQSRKYCNPSFGQIIADVINRQTFSRKACQVRTPQYKQ